jgi:hypothetical protein
LSPANILITPAYLYPPTVGGEVLNLYPRPVGGGASSFGSLPAPRRRRGAFLC